MPASRSKRSSGSRSSRKSSATKRHVAKTVGPFRHINNFMGSVKELEPGLVPTGTGGFDIGLVPKGRKQASLQDMMFGKVPSRKMTEVDRYRAATAAYGEGNELNKDERIRCLEDEYRSLTGECMPKPANGMNIYNHSNPTDVYIPRAGILGGSERIVRHTRPDGRQVNRVETFGGGNGLWGMMMNPGSEASEGFYDENGEKRKFMTEHYSKLYGGQPIPEGFIVGPNSTKMDGTTDALKGKIYRDNDNMGMALDGLKWATYQGRAVAAPINYLNGRSAIPGQRPIKTPDFTLSSMLGGNVSQFPPPQKPAAAAGLEALFQNRFPVTPGPNARPASWPQRPRADFRGLGRYY